MDTATLVMLTLGERSATPFIVRARNNGQVSIRARIQACGFDRETLGEGRDAHGEFVRLRWGQLKAWNLMLKPGDEKVSQPFKVAGDKTHVVVYGSGEGLMDCHCLLEAAVVPVAGAGRK